LAADLILLECTKVRQILEFAGNIVGRDVHNIHQQLSWQLTTDEGRIPHAES
jgi:predicted transcriptional regulator